MSDIAKVEYVDCVMNNKNLMIPDYQRPYKWTDRNVYALLDDMDYALAESKKHSGAYSYRFGTIILHDDGERLNIVDGQQRLITLALIGIVMT